MRSSVDLKPIILSEESKKHLRDNSSLFIQSLVETFTLKPEYFTKYLTGLKSVGNYGGRLFRDIDFGNKHIESEQAVLKAISNPQLLKDYVANIRGMSIVIDEAHFDHIRRNVTIIFAFIKENPRWKVIFEGQTNPDIQLSPEEKQMAEQLAKLNADERKLMIERIAGAFVFMIQALAFDEQNERNKKNKKMNPDNYIEDNSLTLQHTIFTSPILNFIFTDKNTHLTQEIHNKETKTIKQAIAAEQILEFLENNNKTMLAAAKKTISDGLDRLFSQEGHFRSTRIMFESLGDYGHLALNKELLSLCEKIVKLPDSKQKRETLRNVIEAIIEHYDLHYRERKPSSEVMKSIIETREAVVKLTPPPEKAMVIAIVDTLVDTFTGSKKEKSRHIEPTISPTIPRAKSPEEVPSPVPPRAKIDAAILSWQSGSNSPTVTGAKIAGSKSPEEISPVLSSNSISPNPSVSPDGSESDKVNVPNSTALTLKRLPSVTNINTAPLLTRKGASKPAASDSIAPTLEENKSQAQATPEPERPSPPLKRPS